VLVNQREIIANQKVILDNQAKLDKVVGWRAACHR
jgi:hypothetical protein